MNRIDEARAYVGTTPASGAAQFALLALEGLHPRSMVLEYGCGTLHLGKLLLAFLYPGHYCAIEPNGWLVDVARAEDPVLDRLLVDGCARIGNMYDFDARAFGEKFDVVFAHSVLSHAARWQLPQFLAAATEVLAPGGKIIVSLRLGPDTFADEWVYPSVTWFSTATVVERAADLGLRVRFTDYRRLYSSMRPDEIHDWIVFSRS